MSNRLSFKCASAAALVLAGFACGRADDATTRSAVTDATSAQARVLPPSTLSFTSGGVPQGQYTGSTGSVCAAANASNFDTNLKKLDLGAWRMPCR